MNLNEWNNDGGAIKDHDCNQAIEKRRYSESYFHDFLSRTVNLLKSKVVNDGNAILFTS